MRVLTSVLPACAEPVFDVLDHDHRAIDQQADRDGEPAERHDVGGIAEQRAG